MAFFVFAPDAWGQFYKVRLQAVYLGEATGGQLFACEYADPNMSDYLSKNTPITGWGTNVFEAVFERDSWGLDIVAFAQTTTSAPTFVRWYENAECTQEMVAGLQVYKDGMSYAHYPTREEAAAAEPVLTLYGLFSDTDPITYYFRCMSLKDNATSSNCRGAVGTNGAETKFYYNNTENADITVLDGSSSAERQFSIRCFPKRGYKFTNWTIESGTASYVDGFNDEMAISRIQMTSTSTSSASPAIVQMRANYEALPTKTLVLQKAKGAGTVSISYKNLKYYSTSYMSMQTTNLTAFALDETERSYTEMYSSDKVTLTASAAEDYDFKGWYTVDEEGIYTWFSDQSTLVLENWEANKYYAHFGKPLAEDDIFVVGENGCKNLEQAIAAATSSATYKTILLRKDYTIPSGNYTIPAGITLVIPYNAEQGGETPSITRVSTNTEPSGAYRTLTLANGVNLNVYGTIEVSGTQTAGAKNAVGNVGHGRPGAPTYGQLIMNQGSTISFNNGAVLRAWGYVTGEGEIDVRRGAIVKEQFQIMDWKGLINTKMMWENGNDDRYKVLPINQYYIQNVEVRTKYHPGAKLLAGSAINTTYLTFDVGVVAINDVGIIGVKYSAEAHAEDPSLKDDAAIFLMDDEDDSEDTWVRKSYNASTDQQLYEANNSAYLGSLVMKLKVLGFQLNMDSRIYTLPITNNFKVHLLNGNLHVTQNTVMLPGSEIEVNKKATMTVDAGQTLYFYDSNEWGRYVFASTDVFGFASKIKYRPGGVPSNDVRDISSAAGLGDAKLTVHGSVDVKGYLKTTDSGASITSTKEDAGTVIFTNAAPAVAYTHNDTVFQVTSTNPTYEGKHCVSGLLTNEAGSILGNFSQTADTEAGKSYHFIDIDGDGTGEWVNLTEDECFVYDQSGVYYIKPQAYVPITHKVTETPSSTIRTWRSIYGARRQDRL